MHRTTHHPLALSLSCVLALSCTPTPAGQGESNRTTTTSTSADSATSAPGSSATTSGSLSQTSESSSGGAECGNGVRETGEDCDGEAVFDAPCPPSCSLPRGTELWNWTEETTSLDRLLRVSVATSGEIFLAGNSEGKEGFGPLLASLDSDGVKQWALTPSEVESGFMLGAVHVSDGQVFIHGRGHRAGKPASPEVALLRAAYSMAGEINWHSYRIAGEPDYDQLVGPIVETGNQLYFLSIEEQFGNGRSPAVLASSSHQGTFEDEVLLEAPPINRLVRFGDWTHTMMSASATDGELLVGGAAFRNDGSDHALIQRRTTDGTLLNSNLYRNPDSMTARYSDLVELPSSGVVTVGSRRTRSGITPLVHRYNRQGELLWELEPDIAQQGSQNSHAAVTILDTNTVVIVGSRESPETGGVTGWLGCVGIETGQLEWETSIELAPSSFWTYPQDVDRTSDGHFIVVGYGSDADAPHDAFARVLSL